eukprot:contig_7619_g1785
MMAGTSMPFMDGWIIDSGASHHMTGKMSLLSDVHDIEPITITMANGEDSVATSAGTVTIDIVCSGGGVVPLNLRDVLVVEPLSVNLFSITAIMQHRFEATFGRGAVAITRSGRNVFSGLSHGSVFVLPTVPAGTTAMAAAAVSAGTWHRRFNHIGATSLRHARDSVAGFVTAPSNEPVGALCDPCVRSKQTRPPFPPSKTATTLALELVHTDVCGPMPVASIGGARYFVTILDDHTGWKAAVPIVRKSDAADALKDVLQEWETRSGNKVKAIRSDNGGEYLSNAFEGWMRGKGIQHQLTTPYTPQQNGVAERYNRTLMERVVAMLADAGLQKVYWGEAVMAANYVLNRTPQAGAAVTPYEAFHGTKPNVSHLRVSGCPAYVMVPREKRRKLDQRSTRGIFLGYAENVKAYRISVDGAIKISRDVTFDEAAVVQRAEGEAATQLATFVEVDDVPVVVPNDVRSTTGAAADVGTEAANDVAHGDASV